MVAGEGNGNPCHYSCLENPRDKGAWQGIVHGVAKYQTQLSDWEHTHIYTGRVAGFSHKRLWNHIKETELCVKGNWESRRILKRWVLCLRFRWEFPYIGSDLERSEGWKSVRDVLDQKKRWAGSCSRQQEWRHEGELKSLIEADLARFGN